MSKEAEIHFELYRHLMNAIDAGASYHGISYQNADPERQINGGYSDIVVETEDGPFLVIEAKREPVDDPDRDIDPYAKPVIDQAAGYATNLGAPYFATYNGQKLVLFQTFEKGVHLLDRKTREYDVEDISEFASELLREVAGVDDDQVEWDPHSDTFVSRLDSFHTLLQDELRKSLDSKLENDSFVSEYEDDKFGFVRNPARNQTLQVKFRRENVSRVLTEGEGVQVTVTGVTDDNVVFRGRDRVRVIDKRGRSRGGQDKKRRGR